MGVRGTPKTRDIIPKRDKTFVSCMMRNKRVRMDSKCLNDCDAGVAGFSLWEI